MKALVTGAGGFIGSHLTGRLLDDGVTVRGVDRLSDYYDPELKRENLAPLLDRDGFELIESDLNDLDAGELIGDVDVVYHLAGQPGVRASWGTEFEVYLRDNVLGTQCLLEAAREQELDRFVITSSSSIYGDAEHFPTTEDEKPAPVSPYGVTKLAAEHLASLYHRSFGVPAVILRYFTIFGPGQRPDMAFTRFIRAALEGSTIEVLGDGLQERDFTYVDDAVEATIAAASRGRPGGIYNVAGGNSATVVDVLEVLATLVDGELSIEHGPPVPGDARKTGADTSRAKEDLGYAPRTPLAEGLARQFEAAKARLGRDAAG
jgi:UDP-glucuronate 4-epimerase